MSTQTTRKVGCIGQGDFVAHIGRKQTVEYRAWSNMIIRCYSSAYHARFPKSADCEVAEDWLIFQNFARWLNDHEFHNLGYCLDKDLLIKDNRLYSADTCLLLPHEINTLTLDNKRKRGNLPAGVSKHRSRYQALISIKGKNTYLGSYDSPQEAHESYLKAKQKHIIDIANAWKGKIEDKAYDALMNWQVTD